MNRMELTCLPLFAICRTAKLGVRHPDVMPYRPHKATGAASSYIQAHNTHVPLRVVPTRDGGAFRFLTHTELGAGGDIFRSFLGERGQRPATHCRRI